MFLTTNSSAEYEIELTIKEQCFKLKATNHFDLIRGLMAYSDAALFVSPYLYDDFSSLFIDIDLSKIAIELITSISLNGPEQIKKPFCLKAFGAKIESLGGEWPKIHLDKTLHAKLYIFAKDGVPFSGIVTSANLTHSGLNVNHETGILLSDSETLYRLYKDVRSRLDFIDLNRYQVEKLCDVAAYISAKFPDDIPRPFDYDIGLGNILNTYCTPGENNYSIKLKSSANYYIKVSGVKERPILPQHRRIFDQPRRELSFSTNPNKIKIGDCLLDVAIGGGCFLGYYVCASEVREKTADEKRLNMDNERWPYYVMGNNLSIKYGKNWFESPLDYDELVARFKEKNPGIKVTYAGTDHFKGSISFGSSHIRVTREFGEFVRAQIDAWRPE